MILYQIHQCADVVHLELIVMRLMVVINVPMEQRSPTVAKVTIKCCFNYGSFSLQCIHSNDEYVMYMDF